MAQKRIPPSIMATPNKMSFPAGEISSLGVYRIIGRIEPMALFKPSTIAVPSDKPIVFNPMPNPILAIPQPAPNKKTVSKTENGVFIYILHKSGTVIKASDQGNIINAQKE